MTSERARKSRTWRRRIGRLASKANRNLLLEMSRAAFKVDDQSTMLGVVWSLASPIVMLLSLYFIFRNRLGAEIQAYPLYLLLGIVLLNFYTTTTRLLVTVLSGNRPLLLNSTVPRETLIVSHLAVPMSKLLLECGLCALVSLYYGFLSWSSLVLAVPVLASFVALVLGTGLVISVFHCFARDIDHLWSIVVRMLLFVTPVFYARDSLSPIARFGVYWLNPLTPHVEALRGAFMGAPSAFALLHAAIVGTLVLAAGYGAFLRFEHAALERA